MIARLRSVRVGLGMVVLCAAVFWSPFHVEQGLAQNRKYPQTILIIRHGEKTNNEKDVHLSEAGKERAKNLHSLFTASASRPDPFPKPHFIFATHDGENSHRLVETVTPLAQRLKLPIDQEYHNSLATVIKKNKKAKGIYDLRDEIFRNGKYAGKTILISWHHGMIPDLAKELKATDVPAKWGGEVFDRVWKITYDDRGAATFTNLPQRLMPGDSPK